MSINNQQHHAVTLSMQQFRYTAYVTVLVSNFMQQSDISKNTQADGKSALSFLRSEKLWKIIVAIKVLEARVRIVKRGCCVINGIN